MLEQELGGNGGYGGDANSTEKPGSYYLSNCGKDGGAGENCGIVKVHNSVIVYSYGGAGGSGGSGGNNSGGGAGGYPGAGIGRGRSRRSEEVIMMQVGVAFRLVKISIQILLLE